MQPIYHAKAAKVKSRKDLIQAYREITGNVFLPKDKHYWALCNHQPNTKGGEFYDLCADGFMKPNQFFGVDSDQSIIRNNKDLHPTANWYCGDWLQVVRNHYDRFQPGIVSFDSIMSAGCKANYRYIAKVLDFCPKGTFAIVNVILQLPYVGINADPNLFPNCVQERMIDSSKWSVITSYYQYVSSRASMGSFIFINDL